MKNLLVRSAVVVAVFALAGCAPSVIAPVHHAAVVAVVASPSVGEPAPSGTCPRGWIMYVTIDATNTYYCASANAPASVRSVYNGGGVTAWVLDHP
jgi:hypothetical protein